MQTVARSSVDGIVFKDEKGEYWLRHSDALDIEEWYLINEIIFSGKTDYHKAHILVLSSLGKSFLLDGHFQITENSLKPYHESLIILADIKNQQRNHVLICGGGDGVAASLILSHYPDIKTLLIDHDSGVIQLSQKYLKNWNNNYFSKCHDGNTSLKVADVVSEVPNLPNHHYDSILFDLTPPHASDFNYLWSINCLSNIKFKLKNEHSNAVILGNNIDSDDGVNRELLNRLKEIFVFVHPYIIPETRSCLFKCNNNPKTDILHIYIPNDFSINQKKHLAGVQLAISYFDL